MNADEKIVYLRKVRSNLDEELEGFIKWDFINSIEIADDIGVIEYLKHEGIDRNTLGHNGKTAMEIAERMVEKSKRIVELLKETKT